MKTQKRSFGACMIILLIGIFLLSTGAPASLAGEIVHFYHNDHLGSPLAMTDEDGRVVWRRDYFPFGQEIDPGGDTTSNTHKFTGKEFDAETGLYYYGARYYDPVIGRFISVDPAGGVPSNPQTWNRYAYTLNNPYEYVDTYGRWPTAVHNKIIDEAFSEGPYRLPANLRRVLKEASAFADRLDMFSPSGAHRHALSQPGEDKVRAEREIGPFIGEKVKDYKALLSQGEMEGAYFALGQALHALMDSTSLSHEVFQEHGGLRPPIEIFEPDPEYVRRSVTLIRDLYDEAKGQEESTISHFGQP